MSIKPWKVTAAARILTLPEAVAKIKKAGKRDNRPFSFPRQTLIIYDSKNTLIPS